MDGLLATYSEWADRTGIQILEWSAEAKFFDANGKTSFPRPTKVRGAEIVEIWPSALILGTLRLILRLMQDWPLTDFKSALAIAVAYLMFVILGRVSSNIKDLACVL
jgi:hypothetical protein